jgi:hypothetical protein
MTVVVPKYKIFRYTSFQYKLGNFRIFYDPLQRDNCIMYLRDSDSYKSIYSQESQATG